MPDDLLLELVTATPVSGNLENIEDLVRVLVRETSAAVEGLKGSARAFENIWQSIVVDVAKGQTAKIQAARSRFLKAFSTRLRQLQYTRVLLAGLFSLGKAELLDPNALLTEIEDMERLQARVFDRWQSVEDLERLAAEHYPLSQTRLEQLAATHPPPVEWYQGEEERLFQE